MTTTTTTTTAMSFLWLWCWWRWLKSVYIGIFSFLWLLLMVQTILLCSIWAFSFIHSDMNGLFISISIWFAVVWVWFWIFFVLFLFLVALGVVFDLPFFLYIYMCPAYKILSWNEQQCVCVCVFECRETQIGKHQIRFVFIISAYSLLVFSFLCLRFKNFFFFSLVHSIWKTMWRCVCVCV